MLQSIHVKNLALIQEIEVEFGRGLNILTGETGAGKSVLLGSVNLALGGKFDKDMLRKGADSCLVELIFKDGSDAVREKLTQLELPVEEDGTVIVSRRMQVGRSVSKINGESVTARQVKELAELLIDIHGQHEHQSLLHKKKHLEILDDYCGNELCAHISDVEFFYKEWRRLKEILEKDAMDGEARARQQAMLEYECQEIEDARLREGEDDELEQTYRLMVNSRKITENLGDSYRLTGLDNDGAGGYLSRALRAFSGITAYDPKLIQLEAQLAEIDSLLADYNRDVAEYLSNMEFDEADFARVEERLNAINHLKGKYGRTISDILAYGRECSEQLAKLSHYDIYMETMNKRYQEAQNALKEACEELSACRQEGALELAGQLKAALEHLNFLSVDFKVAVRPGQTITANGWDDVEFLISTNPGEELKPLAQVASGGELSRVMLAIKTVLAGRDAIDTLIFDEIDAGISGRTAWKISEKLHVAAAGHQVICITHLPQIAAMADNHFVIEKNSAADGVVTDIYRTDKEGSLKELARLLGSDELSDAALQNAAQMKKQAMEYKTGDII